MMRICCLLSVLILFAIPALSTADILDNIRIGYAPQEGGQYYVTVEKINDKWSIQDISKSPVKRTKTTQEIMMININRNQDYIYVQPAFETPPQ